MPSLLAVWVSRNRSWIFSAFAVALTAFLPFARGTAVGHSFYFRDLSRQFFPLRLFALDGLRNGELRYWNPFVHEGEPSSLLPISYLPDLLQLLRTDEAGLTLSLALHVPLAALAFMALARDLRLSPVAAAGGALAYALGGFSLSSLNFYVYMQAVAWSPLVVLGLRRASEGRPRGLAVGALFTAVAFSTTGVEIVLQAVAASAVLWLRWREPRRALRMTASLALAVAIASPTIAILGALVTGSARAGGFPTDVVLAQSVHPLTLPQVVIGNFLGDLSDLANHWWGSNFFPLGFPYVLSLYLGATLLSTAAVGMCRGDSLGRRAALLAALGAVVSVGRWAGLAAVVELLPLANRFRHPSKVFFTAHIAIAILVAIGLDRLARIESGTAWRGLAALALGAGSCLAGLPLVPHILPDTTRWFLAGFLPPSYTWPDRYQVAEAILGDAATGGAVALIAACLALPVLRRRLSPVAGAAAIVALIGADLVRTGAGLNPMVSPAFRRLSPEMSMTAASMRDEGGRLFSCDAESGPAYFRARQARADAHDAWTFAVFMETLVPYFNLGAGVPSALSRDTTMLVPIERALAPEESGSSAVPSIVGRLKRAGVRHVLSPEPIEHDELHLRAVIAPQRIAPLSIHRYALEGALPLRQVATVAVPAADREAAEALVSDGRLQAAGGVAVEGITRPTKGAMGRVVSLRELANVIDLEVEADRPTVVVLRDAYARGWTAHVNGAPSPVLRADGRHRAVPIPAGRSQVVLRYRPPGLSAALIVSALGMALTVVAWRSQP
jgi:hypothetical protein